MATLISPSATTSSRCWSRPSSTTARRCPTSELRDQLLTLLLAGHETTATALAWTFDLLLHTPATLERLLAELDTGETQYLEAVIDESLRVRPVVPMTGRLLREPADLGGYDLEAGTVVFAAIYMLHTRPDVYPDPYAFRPERFLDDGPETYSWIPFGGGTRRCIGAAFAELELRVVLREVLRSVRLEAGGPAPAADGPSQRHPDSGRRDQGHRPAAVAGAPAEAIPRSGSRRAISSGTCCV